VVGTVPLLGGDREKGLACEDYPEYLFRRKEGGHKNWGGGRGKVKEVA